MPKRCRFLRALQNTEDEGELAYLVPRGMRGLVEEHSPPERFRTPPPHIEIFLEPAEVEVSAVDGAVE